MSQVLDRLVKKGLLDEPAALGVRTRMADGASLREALAQGGMAEVFLAQQKGAHGFEKKVVIKKIRPELADRDLNVRLFIEEAKEEIASIKRHLPGWAGSPDDMELLITVRRSFHTLKGSGRMVGAGMLGELAWSVENMLNRLIERSEAADSCQLMVVERVTGLFLHNLWSELPLNQMV